MRFAMVVAALFSAWALGAEDDLSARDAVFHFLKANVINRQVVRESVNQNADKTVEYDFKRTVKYRNLTQTPRGLTFEMVALIKQNNFDLDPATGKRKEGVAPANADREVTVKVAASQLRSTGELVGLFLITLNTDSRLDSTGAGDAVRLKIENNELVMVQQTPFYTDHFAAGGTFKPGRGEITSRFSLNEAGKLKVTERQLSSFVSPETLEPTSEKKDSTTENVEP